MGVTCEQGLQSVAVSEGGVYRACVVIMHRVRVRRLRVYATISGVEEGLVVASISGGQE